MTLTYPHIGNTALARDVESRKVFAAGLVVKDVPRGLHFRSTASLRRVPAQREHGGDRRRRTRRLTRLLRTGGAQNGCIVALAPGAQATPA